MTSRPDLSLTEQPPPTGQQRRTEATRRALLAAARTVLNEHGYARATVAQIARVAGRAHGTFYLYFENKEDIYSLLLENMWTDLKEQSRSVWRRDTPLESVRVTVARYVSGFADNVDLWLLLDQMSATNPRFTRLRDDYRRQFVRKIERGIESSGARARMDGMQPGIVAELLAGMVDEACTARFLRGRSWPQDVLVDHIVTVWGRTVGYLSNGVPAGPVAAPEE
ncbi:TetR/AcrR family transcriptional regulator [Blastococcus tunisiensis]|uniref:DNA-binding transcriptional regulator, AcrR family n=1 Tax=Blastococcus tunisiensis TaxID=1798228 RepID=A0A1I2A468_9ACTN|nr:TetR/AcrR family transcriptional regulator [Blastococcus sp. DSM 46838]SFE38924.1 DNA-binding transcriptional regulator, AcrR family [Blastococcus sp. DSM 46838]